MTTIVTTMATIEIGPLKILFPLDQDVPRMPIGMPYLNDGEVYVGSIGDIDCKLEHIILLPGDNERLSQKDQLAWAQSVGGDLPDRIEAALLFKRCRSLFKPEAYWTKDRYESNSAYAWYQYFDYGGQLTNRKDYYDCRARAVRRISI